jgi:hypothetical protein
VIPQDKPPDRYVVRSVEMNERKEGKKEIGRVLYDDLDLDLDLDLGMWEDDFAKRIWRVWSKEERERECTQVLTMYKRKDRKVNPIDTPLQDGVNPGGGPLDWIKEMENGELKVHAGKVIPYGSRLTPERLVAMGIGGRTLSREEEELVMERVLFRYEGAIAFEDSHMGLLDPAIESPIVIQTVLHQSWQQ